MRIILCLFFISLQVSTAFAQNLTIEVQSGLSNQVKKMIPLGETILVADVKGHMVLWDIKQDKIKQRLQVNGNALNDILYIKEKGLVVVAGSREVQFFSYDGNRLQLSFSVTSDKPTALYSQNEWIWVASEKQMTKMRITTARVMIEEAFAHGEGAFYTLRIRGDHLLALNHKGAFIYSVAQKKKIKLYEEINTGWYANHWDEKEKICYVSQENKLIAFRYHDGNITVFKTTLPVVREEYVLGISFDKKANLYAGTRSGKIFRYHVNPLKPPFFELNEVFNVKSGSVTNLASLNDFILAGDYYGGVSVLEPTRLIEILALNEDATPALTTIDFSSSSRMISTHKGPRGSTIKVWDIANASILYSINLQCQQVTSVTPFASDSFITHHADGAVFRHYVNDHTYKTETIKAPQIPYVTGTYIALPGEAMSGIRDIRNEIISSANRVQQWTTTDTALVFAYNPPSSPPSCERMPSYQEVQAVISSSGLTPYVKDWDVMDQDLFFMKACRSADTAFYTYAAAKKIPINVATEFYSRIKGSKQGSLTVKDVKNNLTLFNVPVKKRLEFFGSTNDHTMFLVLADDSAIIYNKNSRNLVTIPIEQLSTYFVYALSEHWLAIANEQTIKLYALDGSGATGWIPFGNENFLVHHEKGFFKTRGRNQRLSVVKEGVELPFEYFDLVYNRPDLILKQINKAAPADIELFAVAVEKRKKRNAGKSPVYIGVKPVHVRHEEINFPFFTPTGNVQVNYPKENTHKIQVWVNGTKEQSPGEIIRLNKGLNKVAWEISNKKGDTIWYAQTNYLYNLDTSVTERWFYLGAAIDNYADARMNLQYARKDVRDMSLLFKSIKPHVLIDTLMDAQLSEAGLKQWENILKKASVHDVVVISLSGHGFLDAQKNFYFGTQHTTAKHLDDAISYNQLINLLDSCKARKKMLLLDACHSGLNDDDALTAMLPSHIKIRGAGSEEQSSMQGTRPFRLMQEEFIDLTKHNGTIVIAAAAGAEVAFETEAQQNGLFTYVLMNGLRNKKADADKDGTILTSELQNYLNKEVEQLSNGYQKPTTRQENLGIDWVFWK